MKLFGWLELKEFMNDPDEWHSFLLGLFEILCPVRPRFRLDYASSVDDDETSKKLHELHLMIVKEAWYYRFGMTLGFIIWVVGISALVLSKIN